jgi:hypothetical protein
MGGEQASWDPTSLVICDGRLSQITMGNGMSHGMPCDVGSTLSQITMGNGMSHGMLCDIPKRLVGIPMGFVTSLGCSVISQNGYPTSQWEMGCHMGCSGMITEKWHSSQIKMGKSDFHHSDAVTFFVICPTTCFGMTIIQAETFVWDNTLTIFPPMVFSEVEDRSHGRFPHQASSPTFRNSLHSYFGLANRTDQRGEARLQFEFQKNFKYGR